MKDDKKLIKLREDIQTLVKDISSPPKEQVAFLKKVLLNKKEYENFLKDPVKYCNEQKPYVIINPEIVEKVQRTVLFDAAIKEDVQAYGKDAVSDITEIRWSLFCSEKEQVTALVTWAVAAVGAAAAVVGAAAAVVSAVTSVTSNNSNSDKKFANSELRTSVLDRLKTMNPY